MKPTCEFDFYVYELSHIYCSTNAVLQLTCINLLLRIEKQIKRLGFDFKLFCIIGSLQGYKAYLSEPSGRNA